MPGGVISIKIIQFLHQLSGTDRAVCRIKGHGHIPGIDITAACATGGLSGKTYAWGDEFRPNGKWMVNTYQGQFPVKDTGEDGYAGIAAVAQFPPNGYGLYDMAGNVWQWCSDWYRLDYYTQLRSTGIAVVRNPQGPDSSYSPGDDQPQRAQRGGSFLCTDQYCTRYMMGTRGKGDIDTGNNHVGFRCVIGNSD